MSAKQEDEVSVSESSRFMAGNLARYSGLATGMSLGALQLAASGVLAAMAAGEVVIKIAIRIAQGLGDAFSNDNKTIHRDGSVWVNGTKVSDSPPNKDDSLTSIGPLAASTLKGGLGSIRNAWRKFKEPASAHGVEFAEPDIDETISQESEENASQTIHAQSEVKADTSIEHLLRTRVRFDDEYKEKNYKAPNNTNSNDSDGNVNPQGRALGYGPGLESLFHKKTGMETTRQPVEERASAIIRPEDQAQYQVEQSLLPHQLNPDGLSARRAKRDEAIEALLERQRKRQEENRARAGTNPNSLDEEERKKAVERFRKLKSEISQQQEKVIGRGIGRGLSR